MRGRAFALASAWIVLSACGGQEALPPLTVRDAGHDAQSIDAAIDDAGYDASNDDANVDAGFDAGPPRELVDFTLTGEDFLDFEGYNVYARLEDRVHGFYSEVGSATISSGAFTIEMLAAFDRLLFGMTLHVYIDATLNNVCDAEGDELVQAFVANDEGSGAFSYYLAQGAAGLTEGVCDYF